MAGWVDKIIVVGKEDCFSMTTKLDNPLEEYSRDIID